MTGMAEPLRVACIGMGWWSDVLADAMKRSDKLKIVACYTRSEDKRLARMVAGILRRQGWEPWIDESSIVGGSSWAASIQQALKASSVVVLLITANSVAKEWVLDEIVSARNLRVPIVPAVLEDVRLPDELRFMLQRTQFVNIEAFTSHDSDDQHKRNYAAQQLDSALLGVLERQGRLNPDRARMRIGHVLE